MADFLKSLLNTDAFMSHGNCYLWNRRLVGLHLSTDLAIGFAYIAISLTLAYLVWRAKADIPFSWIFLSFGVFILSCGATHFMEVWTIWTPLYWLSGVVKLLTAAASVTTAIVLPPLVPKSLALLYSAKLSEQRRTSLEASNEALRREMDARRFGEEQVRELNLELEARVEARLAELREVSERLAAMAAIVEHADVAIIGLSLDTAINSWNPAAERLYGYRRSEAVGRPATLLTPGGAPDEIPELIGRVLRSERVNSFETIHVRRTGERIDVLVTLSPIKSAAGEISGVSCFARDITNYKRAEGMFHLAVEAAPNAMVMVDEQGKIVLVNSQTERLFGYPRQELIGQSVEILAPRAYRDSHPANRALFLDHPDARAMGAVRDLSGLRKDGAEFPVEIGLNPIKTSQGTWVLSAIVDITERKRADEEIRRLNQDLERRVAERTAELTVINSELEAFSYSVSHDLRAPLRQIAGFSKILVEDYGQELSPEAARRLQKVQDGAHTMGDLIDGLLKLARLGRQAVSRRLTPLNELVESALEDLKLECLDRQIDWQVDKLGSVECDPRMVRQVFVNLLSNALKYSRARRPAVIRVGQTALDNEQVVFVRDNGAGFDMQYAGKLFGVFQRLHKAEEFEGTGVGLATAQRIVHKHGGRIWAEAEPNEGATFFFTIPASGAPGPRSGPGDS